MRSRYPGRCAPAGRACIVLSNTYTSSKNINTRFLSAYVTRVGFSWYLGDFEVSMPYSNSFVELKHMGLACCFVCRAQVQLHFASFSQNNAVYQACRDLFAYQSWIVRDCPENVFLRLFVAKGEWSVGNVRAGVQRPTV